MSCSKLLVYNIYVASAGRHAHMGNSEDFGEPAAACLSCQPSSVISQTCCSRYAKKIIQKAKKSGGRGKSTMMEWAQETLLWHHPQNTLVIPAELTYLGSKSPDGSAYFQNLDSDDENEIAGSDDADEAKMSEESKEGAVQH